PRPQLDSTSGEDKKTLSSIDFSRANTYTPLVTLFEKSYCPYPPVFSMNSSIPITAGFKNRHEWARALSVFLNISKIPP
ncbi:hypothetical protein KJ865_07705, partial [Myxococcota bacterium]|nr:hypothetical protein [Myxococcota bacterium]